MVTLIIICAAVYAACCLFNFMINPSAEFYGEKHAQRNFYTIRLSGPAGTLILLVGGLVFLIDDWWVTRRDWKRMKSFYEWK